MASSGAARARRYRARRRSGRVVLRVELKEFSIADALIEAGLIDEAHAEDRQRLAAVLTRLIENWAKETVARDGSSALSCGMPAGAQLRGSRMPRKSPPVTEPPTAATVVDNIAKPQKLIEAEAALAEARSRHDLLLAEIRELGRRNSLQPSQIDVERTLRDLHRQRELVEDEIRAARRARTTAAEPHRKAVASALAPLSQAAAEQLQKSITGLQESLAALNEIAVAAGPDGSAPLIGDVYQLQGLQYLASRLAQERQCASS